MTEWPWPRPLRFAGNGYRFSRARLDRTLQRKADRLLVANTCRGAAAAKSERPPSHEHTFRVTEKDERILLRAIELLADATVWNRSDDRRCEDDESEGKRSLFCALNAASLEVLGTYDHRRVALQEVRFAIEEAARGQELEHRLMDYNNLPGTRLQDIRGVLATALDRVRKRLYGSVP